MKDSPVTVCQLLHTLNVGGAEILASRLVSRLSGEKWRFVFFCLDAEGVRAQEMRDAGFQVEVLGRRPGFDTQCMRDLAKLWRKHGVQLVHAHQYTPYFYAMGARGFFRKTPPILFTEHGRFFPDLPNWKHKIFNRILSGSRDGISAVSRSVGDALVKNEGIPASRIEVVLNGIDERRFAEKRLADAEKTALRASLGLTNERVILFTARLDPIKDHPAAICAMKILLEMSAGQSAQKPVLLLAGGGPERSNLEQCISENGLEKHVRLLGERSDVAELLQIAEIFLLTSKSEGIPLTILEAFASGVPVAATNVGGIPEVIESGKNGLLAPSGDSGKIAEHLNRLLTEPEFASSISQNAQERFFREFTETKMVGEYEKIFLRLLGK